MTWGIADYTDKNELIFYVIIKHYFQYIFFYFIPFKRIHTNISPIMIFLNILFFKEQTINSYRNITCRN